ncbi:MAG TPA: O-antigen ligase family protein [Candidatus Limnocylindria bacterium]|nr:O-antigen ligase family protein [Candidatus Limnocylindria bacterium]
MKIIRGGLCLIFTFTVLAHGAVEPWSESLLEIGAALLLVIWAFLVYRDVTLKIRWSALNSPLLCLLVIGFAQLTFHLTVNPYLTRTELLKLVSYLIVFFLTAQAFRERADLMRLAWFLIFLGFIVSLLGIIQHFTAEGKIYWFRELTLGGDPFGPYVNRNHFAGFVELVLPVGLALLVFRGLHRDAFSMVGLMTIVPLGALILSGSRGGIVSLAFELGMLVLLARSRKRPEGPRIAAIAIVGLAAIALITWLGVGKTIERFSNVRAGDVSLMRRATMFRGALHVFLDHPITGAGLGTLVTVYPRYETGYDGRVVDHAHNDYIELLAETGVLGGLCCAVFLWILFREARKNFEAEQGHFSRALHAGAITAVGGLLLHSFVDFNLHIPSNALLFLLQCYLATSPALPSESPGRRHRGRVPEHAASEAAG